MIRSYRSLRDFGSVAQRLQIFFLLWMVGSLYAGVGGTQGFYGYGTFPSARLLPQGQLLLYGQNAGSYNIPPGNSSDPTMQAQIGVVSTPIELLELGGTLHRTIFADGTFDGHGSLAFKIQIPRMDSWQPLLAVGAYDVFAEGRRWENLYFVGGYELNSGDMLLSLELGGVFHRHKNAFDAKSPSTSTSFLASEADFGKLSLILEGSLRQQAISVAPSVWWRPLATRPGDPNSWMYVGAGARLNPEAPASMSMLWGEMGLQLPLQKMIDTIPPDSTKKGAVKRRITNAPHFWLDFNPSYDHFYAPDYVNETALSPYKTQYRANLDVQGVVRFDLPGLYWVNGSNLPIAQSSERSSLQPRSIWDRSYLLFDHEKEWGNSFKFRAPMLGLGMMQKDEYGAVLWQEFHPVGWHPSVLTVVALKEPSLTLQQPLHPIGPSILRWTQLYAEGTATKQGAESVWGSLRIGNENKHFETSVGYGIEAKLIEVRAILNLHFEAPIGVRYKELQVSAFNHLQHHFEMPIGTTDTSTIHQTFTGNGRGTLTSIPWKFRAWKGAKYRDVESFVCDELMDPKNIPAQQTACLNKDTDHDSVPNGRDLCWLSPEDIDGFEDRDGCPDLDNDQDHLRDSMDLCPRQAEDRDGFEDVDGCPDLDNDRDGVPDSLDACKDAKEDFDKFMDEDGCPDIDNDQDRVRDVDDLCPNQFGTDLLGQVRRGCPESDDADGIPYSQDACPSQPEDYDGFEDEDGCPDLDNDQDGILDQSDRCPLQAEIMDGRHDGDGCP